MHTPLLICAALITRSLAAILTPSAAALDPTITPGPSVELLRKQNDDRYMGWVLYSSEWMTQRCESGATYFQSGGHWRCCATTAAGCDVPLACVNGNLLYSFSSTSLTIPCTSAFDDPTDASFTVCNTAFMYENQQDSSPQTNVNCGVSSLNWSYYRVQPDAAKTTSRSSASRSIPAATTAPGSGDATPAEPSLSAQPTESKSSSKAWIAGVVVGPIVGLALIGFLAWFCLRRKKRSNAAAAAAAAPPPPAAYNPQQHAVPGPGPGPASPPQYFPPPMQQMQQQQQQQGLGSAPFGVADGKPTTTTNWAPHSPQSPNSPISTTPSPLTAYGGQQQQQQWPQQGGHAGPGAYGVPSPSLSPAPMAPPNDRPFSSELEGSPHVVSVQPKNA